MASTKKQQRDSYKKGIGVNDWRQMRLSNKWLQIALVKTNFNKSRG